MVQRPNLSAADIRPWIAEARLSLNAEDSQALAIALSPLRATLTHATPAKRRELVLQTWESLSSTKV